MTNCADASNWLLGLRNGKRVNHISIPGSHDSCACYGDYQHKCQLLSIQDQLHIGIRFLDIRCEYVSEVVNAADKYEYLPIYHGSSSNYIFFEEVQSQCVAFLTQRPSEFILMNVQMNNYRGDMNESDFRAKLLQLIDPFKHFWYLGDQVPLLEEVRGRIILVRTYHAPPNLAPTGWAKGEAKEWPDVGNSGFGGLEWSGFAISGVSSDSTFHTQNDWNNPANKLELITQFMDMCANGEKSDGRICLNFTSYTSPRGYLENATETKPVVEQHLLELTASPAEGICVGVVVIDFVDLSDSLVDLVIATQKK